MAFDNSLPPLIGFPSWEVTTPTCPFSTTVMGTAVILNKRVLIR